MSLVKRLILCSCLWIITPLQAEAPSSQSNDTISKEAWLQKIQQDLPTILCKPKSDFMRCFNVTPQECITLSEWTTEACLKHLQKELPETLNNASGEKWGGITGQCVHDLYHTFSSNKFKASTDCKTIKNQQTKALNESTPGKISP